MLAIIRALLLVVAFLFINIVVLLRCVIRPFHRDNVYIAGQWYSMMSRIFGLKVVVRYPENLDTDLSYVMIANHQNTYDIKTDEVLEEKSELNSLLDSILEENE